MAEQTTAERLPEDVDTALAVCGIEAHDEATYFDSQTVVEVYARALLASLPDPG